MMTLFVLVTLIPIPLIVSLLFLHRHRHKGKLLALCLLLQVIAFITVTWITTEEAGDAAYFGAGFATLVTAAVISAVLIPGVFIALIFLVNKPKGWRRMLFYTAVPYSILLAILLAPKLLMISRLPPYSSNVDFYGQVIDRGRPVVSAKVIIENCSWKDDEGLTTDQNGDFHVIAYCANYLYIQDIEKPDGSFCRAKTNYTSSRRTNDAIAIFGNHSFSGWDDWHAYTLDNKYIVYCL